MIHFLLAIPEIVLYGCIILVAVSIVMTTAMIRQIRSVASQIRRFEIAFAAVDKVDRDKRRNGMSLASLDEIRSRCDGIDDAAQGWWQSVDSHVELYTSPEEIEGWFLTEQPRAVLTYETVVSRHFHSAIFNAFPGLLTGAGLTLTFVAILIALAGVHYDKANTVDPVSGIDSLINGLSGKFLSSIVALVLSILFTLYEKRAVRGLREAYDRLLASISSAIPYLSSARVQLDIQRFAAKQTVSVSHISSEVVDRLVGAFNSDVVPALAEGMSSGVADKIQSEFRPTMQQMNGTLEDLKSAIVRLESGKQESVTGEIRTLLTSLESSLVSALSKMGADFQSALTGAAKQEFGNVQGTLEATRQMLSDMNGQFGAMQGAFSTIIEKAEQSTSDQVKIGREQTEALSELMKGMMVKMQESADQNLSNVRSQLTRVVGDLAEKVGTLSRDMMSAAENVARQAQDSAAQVLGQSGEWSEATARRLEHLLGKIEARSEDFHVAGKSLLEARDFLLQVISQNAGALASMTEASRQVQAYSTGLAAQSDALKGLTNLQREISGHLRAESGLLRESATHNEKVLAEYRRSFESYTGIVDGLDQSLGRILATIQVGLRDYNQSIENNFKEIVKIANPMISEASGLLQTQIDELSGQLAELGSVIATSVERVNGRPK